ncbi:MAG: bifunctional folylpolyglutamate synthase/dihydrofolate synthase [Clostridium sp.]
MKNKELIDYIEKVKKSGSNYGLERTVRLLELLGNPHKKLKLIHIAGTNGKGSTSCMIAKLLINKGFKVGNFNSPHLEEYEEMIRINEENISEDKLLELVRFIKPHIEVLCSEGYTHPTEFEIITCLMLYYFYEEGIDYGVIEVGLGGTYDSTNVINPILTIITSISLDHVNILGHNLSEISKNKAGIMKNEVPLIVYPQKEEAMREILKRADELNVRVTYVKEDDGRLIKINRNKVTTQTIEIKGVNCIYNLELALLGEHQILNCALAIKGFEVLSSLEGFGICNKDITESFRNIKWIGRLETIKAEPLVVIDAAHNIEGIIKLKENINKYYKYNNIYLIIGILADKQVGDMINCIAPIAKEIVALTPHNDRAELAYELESEIKKVNNKVVSYENYKEGFDYIYNKADKEDLIIITGSIYMIGDMRKIIK